MNAYSILDTVIGEYLPVFFAHNDATACRALSQDMRHPETNIKTPQDYALYQVGTWNAATGDLRGTELRLVTELVDLITQHKAKP